jgi:hypothetical protein
MTIARDVADAIHLLAELVRDTRELADAIGDGRKFLTREHPEAKADLVEMVTQMQATVEGLAEVTSVVTGFRFTTKGAAVDFEPARFNKYVIAQKKEGDRIPGQHKQTGASGYRMGVVRHRVRGGNLSRRFTVDGTVIGGEYACVLQRRSQSRAAPGRRKLYTRQVGERRVSS